MKRVIVDLTHIKTPRGMHAYMAYIMDFPSYYGRNLDALYDMLTEISEPTQMIIRRPAELSVEMKTLFPRLSLVLHDAQTENENLQVFVEIAE